MRAPNCLNVTGVCQERDKVLFKTIDFSANCVLGRYGSSKLVFITYNEEKSNRPLFLLQSAPFSFLLKLQSPAHPIHLIPKSIVVVKASLNLQKIDIDFGIFHY